jgi:hypothetical protein
MSHIEPELVTENAQKLDAQYKNETPEHHAARMQRYALAFERCDRAYGEYMQTLDTQVNRYRKDAFAHAELKDKSHEEGFLDAFNTLFHKAA